MVGTKDHAEIVRGLVRQIHRDEHRVDTSIEEVDNQIHVSFHLDDVPYVGITLIPNQVYYNGERIVGRDDMEDVGHRMGSTKFVQGAKITDLELPGEADEMGCSVDEVWLEG